MQSRPQSIPQCTLRSSYDSEWLQFRKRTVSSCKHDLHRNCPCHASPKYFFFPDAITRHRSMIWTVGRLACACYLFPNVAGCRAAFARVVWHPAAGHSQLLSVHVTRIWTAGYVVSAGYASTSGTACAGSGGGGLGYISVASRTRCSCLTSACMHALTRVHTPHGV